MVTFTSQNKLQFTGMRFLLLFLAICPCQYHRIMGVVTLQHVSATLFRVPK